MNSKCFILMSMTTVVLFVVTLCSLKYVTAFSIRAPYPRIKQSSFHTFPPVFTRTIPLVLSSSASNIDGASKAVPAANIDPSSPIGFVQGLLSTLSAATADNDGSSKGQCLLDASSESWRRAIYQAIGAPVDVKNTQGVAKALQDAMARKNNQFAILMGPSAAENSSVEPFVATFPSDVVDYRNDGTAWLECRLRHAITDELLVTIGVQLISEQEQWKILTLDWQDFRPQFYPGLSGREWLRSF
jgi:hypothetical protein